jgi:MFS family permease
MDAGMLPPDSPVALRQIAPRRRGLPATGDRHLSSWTALQNRNFRLYFAGSVTSDFGTWLQNTAQVLLAYRLTHSVLAVGLVTCAQFSSPFVLSPWAAVMTNRFGSRKTLLGTQVASAALACSLAALVFCGKLDEAWLVTGAVASGMTYTFAMPARSVIVRRMVAARDARAAYAMDSVSYNLGRAVAPPVSVLLIETSGFGWVFAVNAASFIVFTAILARLGRGENEPLRRSRIRDGYSIARSERTIMVLLLMVATVTIADDPVTVLGPALASHLHVSGSWSGWFIAALGAGTVVGSIQRTRHRPSMRSAAIALAALGICMMFFVLTAWVWVSVAAAFAAGVTCLLANAATRTLLATAAGPAREASVMAVWAVAWAGSKPFASLVDGLLAGSIGVRWTGVILALPALVPLVVVVSARSCQRRGQPANGSAIEIPRQALPVELDLPGESESIPIR